MCVTKQEKQKLHLLRLAQPCFKLFEIDLILPNVSIIFVRYSHSRRLLAMELLGSL